MGGPKCTLLISFFHKMKKKVVCSLTNSQKPCSPVLYFIMMVLLLLYTTPKNTTTTNKTKKLDQKIMKVNSHPTTNCNPSATNPLKKKSFFYTTLKPKAREMFLF